MTRPSLLLAAALATAFACSACSNSEEAAPAASAPAAQAGASDKVRPIPVLPGYKYYAGGPVMRQDSNGKFRLSSFKGEVATPPSRGMIFGAKVDGDQMEYRVWGNGIPLSLHRGVMRDGVLWESYAESYRDGKVVAREEITHDDVAKKTKVVTQDLDPETGEVIRTKEALLGMLPPAMPADMADDEDEEEEEDEAPAAPAAGK